MRIENMQSNKLKGSQIPEFLLFSGPLQRLGSRLGLVRNETNTVWLGISLGLVTWTVLVLLALLHGAGQKVFSLSVIGAHVRLLVAIPLFFLCETLVGPRMVEFVRYLARSNIVAESELPALAAIVRRVRTLNDSWVVEVIFIVIAFVFPLLGSFIYTPGHTGNWVSLIATVSERFGLNLTWYLGFCLPLFRFLLLRWIWHMVLWWYFLWQVKNLNLQLLAIHSDGAGGLGVLEIVQEHFMPLILAISAVYSASFVENLVAGEMTFESLYFYSLLLLIFVALIFVGPLFIFSYKLWVCRSNGLNAYMTMASHYVQAFDRKWIQRENVSGESQLGTPDVQALSDLTNSVSVARGMRKLPISKRLVLEFSLSLILPLVPLVFFKYPINQLAVKLFQILTGP